jgi:hypothetical protein
MIQQKTIEETAVEKAKRILDTSRGEALLSTAEWRVLVKGLVVDADRYLTFKRLVYDENDTSLDAMDSETLDKVLDERIANAKPH